MAGRADQQGGAGQGALVRRYLAEADRLDREAEGQGRAGSPADSARLADEATTTAGRLRCSRAGSRASRGTSTPATPGVAGHLAAGVGQ